MKEGKGETMLNRWIRRINNFLLYGIWTACEHEWFLPIAFPALRHCPHCGATREERGCGT